MPRFLYGAKNGMSTVVTAIRLVCSIYGSFSGAITEYITTHVTDPTQRAQVLAWLNGASAVCGIIELTVRVTEEN